MSSPAHLIRHLLIVCLAMTTCPAWAEGQIVGLSPASKAALDLYEDTGAPPSKTVDAPSLKFPIDVLENRESGRFLKIKLEGKDYFVRLRDVKVKPPTNITCVVAGSDKPNPTGSTAGIGSAGCP
ncbi:MAG: hypothetical protein QM639_06770 [Rhodocyclaceae bacterium]